MKNCRGVEVEDVKDRISQLYGKVYSYNNRLLNFSEKKLRKEEHYKVIDIFDFYITSHAQAYLKNLYFDNIFSVGFLFNIRCMMEGLALKKMYQKGKISSIQEELLQKQVFLIEYRYYHNSYVEDIVGDILVADKLNKDRSDAWDFYKERLKGLYTEKQIERICNSSIPFLCNTKTSYRQIIEEELGKECAHLYGYYSSLIHPSVNSFYLNEGTIKSGLAFLEIIIKEYDDLPPSEYSLKTDYSLTGVGPSRSFIELCQKQQDLIDNIADAFEQKFYNNYVSNTLRTIAPFYLEMSIEKSLGLTEQIKSKWKSLIELQSTFYDIYCESAMDNRKFQLLDEHMRIQTLRNFELKYSMDEAYTVYSTIFSNPCTRKDFEQGFLKELGYTIDENGRVKSLSEIVRTFAKHFDCETTQGTTLGKAMVLDYLESQMLSHANGYMWFSNQGAFMDVNNIIIAGDIGLLFILRGVKIIFETHRKFDENKEYKTIINILRNSIKKLEKIFEEKQALLSLPLMKKWDAC